MPVVGTGTGGARGSSGAMIAGLLQLVDSFVSTYDVDVALVVKNDRMFSAAQAHRRQLSQHWDLALGPRLAAAARELAGLAASERLCIFLGAGVSVGAGLPAWKELLGTLANRPEVAFDEEEIRQLATLGLPDQAAVVASRLGAKQTRDGVSRIGACGAAGAEDGGARDGDDGSRAESDKPVEAYRPASGPRPSPPGDSLLASLVVDELSSKRYSITHGLLAGLPISAVVTTNYDRLFETAWRAADKDFNVLPYETQPSDRFILKLHGDVNRPEDIVLTRSQMLDSREQRKALSGIVQTMLLTKHLLFVGFSLQDPNFSECLPMDLTDGLSEAQRVPNSECARLMEIFLDKVSLDSSTTTRHLLDGDFKGVFSPQEDALKRRLLTFREHIAKNDLARQSSGFAVVQKTLRRLGDEHSSSAS